MASLFDTRSYLTNFDSTRTGNILTDVLVVGSGVAGARAAIEAAKYGLVTLLSKGAFDESSTQWAQGGIAAVIAPEDSPQLHFEDTMRVGCGLNDAASVQLLVNEGPKLIEELVEWGITLDREWGQLALTREGGHSLNRVVHAHGDQTGAELVTTLRRRVHETANIRVFEKCFLIDLVTLNDQVVGAVAFHELHGHQIIWAKQTILATGGCGQLWRETTNPTVATGDGVAAAYRAGATVRDMELMQFHPTTLYIAGAGRALISEAVRGEGGHLVDRSGGRFMLDYHPDAELAPRDIVSRAIRSHVLKTQASCVYLDVRQIVGFKERFPYITRLCADFDIDVANDLIPVQPSAHYMVGGVEVSLDGSSSVKGLLCCGESASTGVHGANRLASNSLLEGLVFGKLTGKTAGEQARSMRDTASVRQVSSQTPPSLRTGLDLADIRNSLRSVMWRNAGMVRCQDRLAETCDILAFWDHYTLDKTFDEVSGWELQNMLTVARLVTLSAMERSESIGVHHRSDAKSEEPATLYHVTITRDPECTKATRVKCKQPDTTGS